MPGKLDDYFRKGLQNIPDADPPPGQWERIQRRELVVKPDPSGFAGYWVVGSLVLGLLIGSSAMWWYTSVYAIDRAVAIESDTMNKVMAEADLSLSALPAGQAEVEEIRPTPVMPAANVAPAANGYEQRESPSVSEASPGNISGITRTAIGQTAENPRFKVAEEVQKDRPEAMNPAISSSPGTRVRAENNQLPRRFTAAPVAVLPQPTLPQMRTPDKARATLHGYAGSAFIPLPKTIGRRPTPAGRWEVGLSFAPGLTNSRVTSRVFTEQNNGNAPQIFNFNNQQIELFADDIFDQEVQQQLQLASMSLEGGRQFASGVRLGLGMSYSPYSLSGLSNPNDVLAPLLLEGEFATYNWSYEKRFSAFMTSGYTFLRRRKVRPYLGLRVGLDFYQEGERKSYLLRGQDGRSEEFLFSRYNSNTGLRELILNVTAQVGVQYQAHKRISLGVDVLPELAAGVRYRF